MKRHCTYIIVDEATDVAVRSYYSEEYALQELLEMLKIGRKVYLRTCYD